MIFLGGDFRFFWPSSIKDFASLPSAWDSSLNTGLGQSQLSSLWITSYFNFTALFTKLGLSWDLIQILFWVLPALAVSFLSSFFLFKYFFNEKKYSILSGVIYSLNTYFLLVLTGGQLGVSLAYSLVPLVLLSSIKLLDDTNLKNSILAGLVLSLQLLFDPRMVYITLIAIFLYLVFNLQKLKKVKLSYLIAPFGITVLLNLYWILPLFLTKSVALPKGFNSISSFKFFSFADFSHSLSLLHPNWPDNIFGKIYFLDPKFLLFPIISFSSLLFKKNKNILFFSTLALLGVFLAKGSNPPFGQVNLLLFEHFPGMSMFRDPTKWYTLIALSYSILIPFSVLRISEWLKPKIKIPNVFFVLTVLYLLFLISPIAKQIKVGKVPQDYAHLANFLSSQKTFSRTLWIPKWQRFGYFSNNHPAVGREELYQGNAGQQISKLNQNLLKDLSVKYIIVPYDSQGEIFLKDRRYDNFQYEKAVSGLRKISWLKEIKGFGKIRIFKLSGVKEHFWSPSKDLGVAYRFVNPDEYIIQVKNSKKGELLVFSEGFDKNWKIKGNFGEVSSMPFEKIVNSFILPKDGSYDIKVYYKPQKWVKEGLIISGLTLIFILGLFRFSNL